MNVNISHWLLFAIVALLRHSRSQQQGTERIQGTIYADNWCKLYVNGEAIAEDPIDPAPHNAFNVTFNVSAGEDVTFAILVKDFANDSTGLELGNRCVGSGSLIAMFSNGVVTNSAWTCYTYHYGPVNWQGCYAALDDRNGSGKVLPLCIQQNPIEGCFARESDIPEYWTQPEFDDSRWPFALEWEESYVGWGG